MPSWSPDGKYLIAVADNPSRMMLYSRETGAWKEFRKLQILWGYWVWARDSNAIYIAVWEADPGIYRLTVPNGHWTRCQRSMA
jgi:hypothetical protein